MNDQEEYECLGKEEERLQFDNFSKEDAYHLGTMIAEKAKSNPQALSIEIYHGGLLTFRYFPSGANMSNELWLRRKYNSVVLQGTSSLRFKMLFKMHKYTLADSALDPDKYALSGGGYPIVVRDTGMVGVVCVSGYPDVEDHNLVVWALKKLKSEKESEALIKNKLCKNLKKGMY